MKKQLLSLFLIASAFVATAQDIDVLHYRYSIELNDANDTIHGKASITFIPHHSTDKFVFDLTSADKGKKGMYVSKASLLPFHSTKDIEASSFSLFNNKLTLKGTNSFRAGDTASAIIEYYGVPADGLIISKNKFNKKTFFADNWPNRAHHWIPCNDNIADKATVEFIVTAPIQYQVVSNGVQIEESNLPGNRKLTHWKEDIPLPTKVMVIGVAEFAVQHAGMVNNCIPVSSWVYPENKADGFNDYAPAVDILQWFNDYIGPYPYKKLANVQSKTMFGGMENAGAIFYFENSINGNRTLEGLLAHEIVHQWFGDMATEKSFAHLWLSEGFASYLTHVYMEAKYGADSLNKRMKGDRETVLDFVKNNKRPVVDTNSNYMKLLNPNSYQKGSWVLHMLRRQLGDPVFHKSIRDYYAAYAGRNADTKDLQQVFEKNSGKNLEQFFKQWLYTPVNPELSITWKHLTDEKKISITVEQLQSSEPFMFSLDIEMKLPPTAMLGSKKNQLQQLNITKKTETFTYPVKNKPLTVVADPSVSLLFTVTVKEEK